MHRPDHHRQHRAVPAQQLQGLASYTSFGVHGSPDPVTSRAMRWTAPAALATAPPSTSSTRGRAPPTTAPAPTTRAATPTRTTAAPPRETVPLLPAVVGSSGTWRGLVRSGMFGPSVPPRALRWTRAGRRRMRWTLTELLAAAQAEGAPEEFLRALEAERARYLERPRARWGSARLRRQRQPRAWRPRLHAPRPTWPERPCFPCGRRHG